MITLEMIDRLVGAEVDDVASNSDGGAPSPQKQWALDNERAEARAAIMVALSSHVDKDALIEQMAGALNFILAFYEPGQRYLDTNAWTQAEASGRRALKAAKDAGYFGGSK